MNKEVLKNIFTKKILNPHIPRYDRDFYYKPGDTSSLVKCTFNGFISSGATKVEFVFNTEKSMKYINSVKIKDFNCSFRSIEGYFRVGGDTSKGDFVNADFSETTAVIVSNNMLRVDLVISAGYKLNANTNATNNRPVSINFASLELEFSDVESDESSEEGPEIFD